MATSGGKREKARSCSWEFLLAVKHLKERLVQEGTKKRRQGEKEGGEPSVLVFFVKKKRELTEGRKEGMYHLFIFL